MRAGSPVICRRSVRLSRSCCGGDVRDDFSGSFNQLIKRASPANVKSPKALEELLKTLDGRNAKHFAIAVVGAAEPVGPVPHRTLELPPRTSAQWTSDWLQAPAASLRVSPAAASSTAANSAPAGRSSASTAISRAIVASCSHFRKCVLDDYEEFFQIAVQFHDRPKMTTNQLNQTGDG
jgi:hypothetical protein